MHTKHWWLLYSTYCVYIYNRGVAVLVILLDHSVQDVLVCLVTFFSSVWRMNKINTGLHLNTRGTSILKCERATRTALAAVGDFTSCCNVTGCQNRFKPNRWILCRLTLLVYNYYYYCGTVGNSLELVWTVFFLMMTGLGVFNPTEAGHNWECTCT